MPAWQTTASEIVYETPWIKVHRDQATNQLGEPITYSFVELQNPSVFIVPVNEKREVLLQSVFRYTLQKRLLETPAGYVEPGEDPLDAAKRELKEETGMVSDSWHNLGRMDQIAGTGRMPAYVFLAENVRADGEFTDKSEDIEDRRFASFDAVDELMANGKLTDSAIIAILHLVKIHYKKEQ